MKTFKDLLIELAACKEAMEWVEDKTIEEVLRDSWRGDWLLWLARKLDLPIQQLTLAKGRCANTVRHLMHDDRSIKAVDAAIAFGEGKITREELKDAAYASAAYVATAAASAAAYAAYVAAYAAYATAAASAAAYAAYVAAYAADAAAAKKKNQEETSGICVEILGQLLIDEVNKNLSYEIIIQIENEKLPNGK